ncbi:MAG: NADH-quinone oxidoreductase subunit M [Pseudomonadota bacterium]
MTLPEISAATQVGFPLLSAIVLLPAIAALVISFMKEGAVKIAIGFAVVELFLTVFAWMSLDGSTAAMQLAENAGLYHLAIDGVSAMFLPATALLTLFAVMYARQSVSSNVSGYLTALLLSQAALMGAFSAANLGLFWLFFVAEIFPCYYLIKRWGTGDQRDSVARDYLSFMGLAAAAIGIGFLLLAMNAEGGFTFDYATIAAGNIDSSLQTVIFFVLAVGFAIKAPLFPLHSWLPKVLEHGPLVGMSVFLVGIKLGAYGLLRYNVPLLPEATGEWFWLMAAFGVASMVYGAMIAMIQTNLRRLMAFASISHMGVITLGIFSLNVAGIEGGILQALNLGITGAGLFLIASFLSSRVGSPDLSNMGGLYDRAPYMAMGFLVIALAAVGMPGTSGFNGEHLVIIGAFEKHWLMSIFVGLGTVLTAAYFLRYYMRGFLGDAEEREENRISDLDLGEKVIVGALTAVVLWIGLYTTPFLSTMKGSVYAISEKYDGGKSHALSSPMGSETHGAVLASDQTGSVKQ